MNVPLEIFQVGDTVKVAGWPSKRSNVRLYGTNLLADDGQELVMSRYSKPLWSTKALGYGSDFLLFEPIDLAAHGEGGSSRGEVQSGHRHDD